MTTFRETRELEGATFHRASLRGARFRHSDVSGVRMRGVDADGLDLDSHDLSYGQHLWVNGVDVVPFVEAELDRRMPGRSLRHSETPEGLREAWTAVRAAWHETTANAPRDLVEVGVDDEWCLAETLRHLVLATDAWLGKAILGRAQPFHEIGVAFSGAEEWGFDTSVLRADVPAYDEVLAVRAERQAQVTAFLDDVTRELLAEEREDPWGGDWAPTVGDCLRVILEEEWAHLRYADRDLAILEG